jgi:hypothetical protein
MARHELPQIQIASPCPASWDDMAGDDRSRHCRQCNRQVHNISELTTPEVEELVRNARGKLCVRLYRRADGKVMTKDCPKGLVRTRLRLRMAFASALASIFGIGCAQQPVLGDMAVPSTGKIATPVSTSTKKPLSKPKLAKKPKTKSAPQKAKLTAKRKG